MAKQLVACAGFTVGMGPDKAPVSFRAGSVVKGLSKKQEKLYIDKGLACYEVIPGSKPEPKKEKSEGLPRERFAGSGEK